MSINNYKNLFSEGYIGNVKIRNRIVMTPMGTGHCGPDSRITQELIDFYATRAKGGVGMIITETNYQSEIDVTPITFGMARLDHPNKIARHTELADMVKYYGAVPCIQLSIGMGRQSDAPGLVTPVAPSECPAVNDSNIMCKELSHSEIKTLVANIARSAEYAATAGFPVAEIHGHAGYLIDQFMSPDINKRTDEYGGNIKGRLRIVKEIREEIRKRVGNTIAVTFRISVDQKYPGYRTLEEGIEICKMLEEFGYDALNVDSGRYESIPWIFPTSYLGTACMKDLSYAIKKNVKIPVINAGNYNNPMVAEEALESGCADFIAVGRSLLADPDWANKARYGKEEEIRHCIRCNEKCITRVLEGKELTCAVNPQCGRESRFTLPMAEQKKRITIVGGGPAGIETAIIASKRGHIVTLLEKEERLGGQLNYASMEPFKWPVRDFTEYIRHQAKINDIDLRLGVEATIDTIRETDPDVVVVATGAKQFIPGTIKSADKNNVLTVVELYETELKGDEKIVVIGGGLVGTETALGKAMDGHDVTIIEMLDDIANDINIINKVSLIEEIKKHGVKVMTSTSCKEIGNNEIICLTKDAKEIKVSYDIAVIATGSQKEDKLVKEVEENYLESYAIGDCTFIGKISDAVHSGYITGSRI